MIRKWHDDQNQDDPDDQNMTSRRVGKSTEAFKNSCHTNAYDHSPHQKYQHNDEDQKGPDDQNLTSRRVGKNISQKYEFSQKSR